MMRGIAVVLAALLAGCATQAPRTIERTVYVRSPVPVELLTPCRVAEPDGACWRDTERVLCNGQVAELLESYRAALARCDVQLRGVLDIQK